MTSGGSLVNSNGVSSIWHMFVAIYLSISIYLSLRTSCFACDIRSITRTGIIPEAIKINNNFGCKKSKTHKITKH